MMGMVEGIYAVTEAPEYISRTPDPRTGKRRPITINGVLHHIYHTHQLKPRRLGGKILYFTQADLDAFIAQRGSAGHRRNPPPTEPEHKKPTGKKREHK